MRTRHRNTNSIGRESLIALSFLTFVSASVLLPAAGAVADGTELFARVTERGRISVSADGAGTRDPAGVPIQVDKPNAAAAVRHAYLACASRGLLGPTTIADGAVSLDGSPIAWSDRVPGASGIFQNVYADVTSIVKPRVDAATPGLVDLTLTEADPSGFEVDGCGLYVIFDDPTQATSNTVILLFGGVPQSGDEFAVTIAEPLIAGDTAQMGVAIGWSTQGEYVSQAAGSKLCGSAPEFTPIDVNGTRLTSCAGGTDDGVGIFFGGSGAGGLAVTVGGIGDDPANPADPLQQPGDGTQPRVQEDELYDLGPFLGPTGTLIGVKILSPVGADNVFGGHLFLTTPAVFGEGILLTPDDAQNLVGADHTLSATVVDDAGAPQENLAVTFTVVSGPNTGATGTSVTDPSGLATFAYTGSGGAGIDTIEATFTDSQGQTRTSNQVTGEWVAPSFGEKTLCSTLRGHSRGHRILPDVDVFRFEGAAGEEVTALLEEQPGQGNAGNRAILALVHGLRAPRLLELDKGTLPGQITATLPAAGTYFVAVTQPLWGHQARDRHAHHRCRLFKPFQGDYCLTVRSSGDAFSSLRPTRSVEP